MFTPFIYDGSFRVHGDDCTDACWMAHCWTPYYRGVVIPFIRPMNVWLPWEHTSKDHPVTLWRKQ